jgi:hypothetical protein
MTVAVINDEVEYEATPLTKRQAVALDKKIRTASDKLTSTIDKVATDIDALIELIDQAANGQIHVALELPSWTAWFKDAVRINPSDRLERKTLVTLMSGKGMSQRQIGAILNVSQKTVDRDLDDVVAESDDSPVDTLGSDGKTYSRSSVVDSDDEVIEGEFVDDEPVQEADEPMKAVDIVAEFEDETVNLVNAVSAMHDLTQEPNWSKAVRRIAKADMNYLVEAVTEIQKFVDLMMEP